MKTIKEILTEIANIAMSLSIINFKAVSICQKLGFNGFKRWHKCFAKEFFNYVMCLEMKAFDYYSTSLDLTGDIEDYEPKTLIYHFQSYKDLAEKYLAELGECNKEFVSIVGFEAPLAECIEKKLLKQLEKCNRMVARYKSIGSEATGMHDLHVFDDELHKKMKEVDSDGQRDYK